MLYLTIHTLTPVIYACAQEYSMLSIHHTYLPLICNFMLHAYTCNLCSILLIHISPHPVILCLCSYNCILCSILSYILYTCNLCPVYTP
jgi:hypothetical protein